MGRMVVQRGSGGRKHGCTVLRPEPMLEVHTRHDLDAWRDLKKARERGVSFQHSGQRVATDSQLKTNLFFAHEAGDGGLIHLHHLRR